MKYGWKRSPLDIRDKLADPAELVVLPEVDPRLHQHMPTVFDQGNLGSCTANAVAACLQYDVSLDRTAQGLGPARRRSRLDIYYGERSLEGELGQGDTGAYGRDGFKYAQQTGVLLEEVWPYDIAKYEQQPPTAAKRHKLEKNYAAVAQDVNQIEAVLSNKQLVAFGFEAYASFEQVGMDGLVPMPRSGEQHLGGHEMVVVGYLAKYPDHALVRNSWGSAWAVGGYCLFPWEYLTDYSLAGDLRTIVRPL